jgi:Flp pilus assembly protein TadD
LWTPGHVGDRERRSTSSRSGTSPWYPSPWHPWYAALAVVGAGLLAAGCANVEGARLYRSGTQALERGDAERAIADLEGAAERVPGVSEVHNRLGVAYAAAGRREDAIREFRSALEIDCSNAAAARNLRRAQDEEEPPR